MFWGKRGRRLVLFFFFFILFACLVSGNVFISACCVPGRGRHVLGFLHHHSPFSLPIFRNGFPWGWKTTVLWSPSLSGFPPPGSLCPFGVKASIYLAGPETQTNIAEFSVKCMNHSVTYVHCSLGLREFFIAHNNIKYTYKKKFRREYML